MKSNTNYRFHSPKPTLEENHEIFYSSAIKWFISIIFRENLTTSFWIILPCSTYWWETFFPKYRYAQAKLHSMKSYETTKWIITSYQTSSALVQRSSNPYGLTVMVYTP